MKTRTLDRAIQGPDDGAGELRLDPDSAFVVRVLSLPSDAHQASEARRHGLVEKQLTPRQAPGRSTRKVRAYAAEISRLREAGYSLEAIREALADAGMKVSRSTVWREATRPVGGNQSTSTHS